MWRGFGGGWRGESSRAAKLGTKCCVESCTKAWGKLLRRITTDGWRVAALGTLEIEKVAKIVGAEGPGVEAVGAELIEEVEVVLRNTVVLTERRGLVISTRLENLENFRSVAQTRGLTRTPLAGLCPRTVVGSSLCTQMEDVERELGEALGGDLEGEVTADDEFSLRRGKDQTGNR